MLTKNDKIRVQSKLELIGYKISKTWKIQQTSSHHEIVLIVPFDDTMMAPYSERSHKRERIKYLFTTISNPGRFLDSLVVKIDI